uniref:DM2 domain-containing protein n=1 Tax=viral metagenome TaxID=1070528 RepID=A0A6C0D347_9ZZZZ
MARASKPTEKTTSASTVPATPVTNELAPAKVSKPRAKKAAPVAAEPAAAPVVDAAAAVDAVVASTDAAPALIGKLTEFSAKLQQLAGLFSTIKNDFKTLEKTVNREMKVAQKASSKRRRNVGNRKPSGFIKPTRISDELAEFLGRTIGTEMARTEVSKEINVYITANGLQNKSNGRQINPDAKLSKLLKLEKDDVLTYFNLQRYMKHHFIKPEVAATA